VAGDNNRLPRISDFVDKREAAGLKFSGCDGARLHDSILPGKRTIVQICASLKGEPAPPMSKEWKCESPRARVPGSSKIRFWPEDKSGSRNRQEGEIGDRSEKGIGLILSREEALYLKHPRKLENPGMKIAELEALLGTPREHPDFTMWFLKEQGWAARIRSPPGICNWNRRIKVSVTARRLICSGISQRTGTAKKGARQK
jgi:hypothetical protein